VSIEDFAEITRRVIRKNGFDDFMPTLCLPEQKHITVLEGVPEGKRSEMRTISLELAQRRADRKEEFLLAFREDDSSFRIVRRFKGKIRERVFSVPNSN
jgi:hypothetical protein